MRTRPDGADLLETAQRLLRTRLLAQMPASCKHEALMICNAMNIAARQLRAGEQPERDELASLNRLLGTDEWRLAHANRLLAQALRSGLGDPDSPQASPVLEHLRRVTAQSLAQSNPDYR